ncbi:MAG: hypothetical protein IPO07_08500 [Haliscomenobacter sp.]|nr:hypothetical protein [Haliscomenobacter sp.]MBK9488820.1 hypothetical protein [Haliscomenobacter sp.]
MVGGEGLKRWICVNWVVCWLGIVLVVSFLLSLVPAYQAKRVSVREVLGYE